MTGEKSNWLRETSRLSIRNVETQASGGVQTDVYLVNEDPNRWMHVARAILGTDGSLITIWDQPQRAWSGQGQELQKKGCCFPPAALTDEQQKCLALLFQKMGITPPKRVTPVQENWQI